MGRGRGDKFKAPGMSNFYILESVGRRVRFRGRDWESRWNRLNMSREKLKWEARSVNSWSRAHWTGSIISIVPKQYAYPSHFNLKNPGPHSHFLVLWLIPLGPTELSVLNLHLENSTSSGEQLGQHWDPRKATASHASVCGGCKLSLTLELPNSRESTVVH